MKMHKLIAKLKQIAHLFSAQFPSKLPIGMMEFNIFYNSIIGLYSYPDDPSYKQAIATMIMHLGPTVKYKSKAFFSAALHKSMANQIAYGVIDEIRQSEKILKQKEVTTLDPNMVEPLLEAEPKKLN